MNSYIFRFVFLKEKNKGTNSDRRTDRVLLFEKKKKN